MLGAHYEYFYSVAHSPKCSKNVWCLARAWQSVSNDIRESVLKSREGRSKHHLHALVETEGYCISGQCWEMGWSFVIVILQDKGAASSLCRGMKVGNQKCAWKELSKDTRKMIMMEKLKVNILAVQMSSVAVMTFHSTMKNVLQPVWCYIISQLKWKWNSNTKLKEETNWYFEAWKQWKFGFRVWWCYCKFFFPRL